MDGLVRFGEIIGFAVLHRFGVNVDSIKFDGNHDIFVATLGMTGKWPVWSICTLEA